VIRFKKKLLDIYEKMSCYATNLTPVCERCVVRNFYVERQP
jgi:hypothetical protein